MPVLLQQYHQQHRQRRHAFPRKCTKRFPPLYQCAMVIEKTIAIAMLVKVPLQRIEILLHFLYNLAAQFRPVASALVQYPEYMFIILTQSFLLVQPTSLLVRLAATYIHQLPNNTVAPLWNLASSIAHVPPQVRIEMNPRPIVPPLLRIRIAYKLVLVHALTIHNSLPYHPTALFTPKISVAVIKRYYPAAVQPIVPHIAPLPAYTAHIYTHSIAILKIIRTPVLK